MTYHGFERPLRACSGAAIARVVHRPRQRIGGHRHDWACLTLPIIGSYAETHEFGSAHIDGPSLVMHPPGAFHADIIGDQGLETISMQLDPDWLPSAALRAGLDRSRIWLGGRVAGLARKLAGLWQDPRLSDADLARATARCLGGALQAREQARPGWFAQAAGALCDPAPPPTSALARSLDLNPAWFARAYRLYAGEGLQETVRRKRVEAAAALLRNGSSSLADVAAAGGFCDQSHMNRCFLAVLGRTPGEVRREAVILGAA